jgi:hypothetical protein
MRRRIAAYRTEALAKIGARCVKRAPSATSQNPSMGHR